MTALSFLTIPREMRDRIANLLLPLDEAFNLEPEIDVRDGRMFVSGIKLV